MTDDAEISPLVENRGTTFEVVILSTRTGAPPHCLDNRLRILTWRGGRVGRCGGRGRTGGKKKKKHISDSQHSGNMFIVFLRLRKTHADN